MFLWFTEKITVNAVWPKLSAKPMPAVRVLITFLFETKWKNFPLPFCTSLSPIHCPMSQPHTVFFLLLSRLETARGTECQHSTGTTARPAATSLMFGDGSQWSGTGGSHLEVSLYIVWENKIQVFFLYFFFFFFPLPTDWTKRPVHSQVAFTVGLFYEQIPLSAQASSSLAKWA